MPGVSQYPCAIHGKRVVGRLDWIAPAVVYRGSRRSRKMRVCSPCLDNVFTTLGTSWIRASTESEDPGPTVCGSCGIEQVEGEEWHAFFATCFRRGQEREDWFGIYCRECADQLVSVLGLEA